MARVVIDTNGKAEYIVSGDKHLLKIASYEKTQIVSVNQFIQIQPSVKQYLEKQKDGIGTDQVFY